MSGKYRYQVLGDFHAGNVLSSKWYDCSVEPFHPALQHKWRLIPAVSHRDPKVEWVDFTCTRALYRATVNGKDKRSYRRVTVNHEMRCVIVHVRRGKQIAIGGPLYEKYADYIGKSLLE